MNYEEDRDLFGGVLQFIKEWGRQDLYQERLEKLKRQREEERKRKEKEDWIKEMIEKNEDMYSILGIKESATTLEIKKQYKSIVLKIHPDKRQQHKEYYIAYFKIVQAVYEILKDPYLRIKYNVWGYNDDVIEKIGNGSIYIEYRKIKEYYYNNGEKQEGLYLVR